ncbi:MAG: copper oxidase [Deltaproteobacteria bacterium]|nr:copper oxidase [Deltaproteobacteria bacterium]
MTRREILSLGAAAGSALALSSVGSSASAQHEPHQGHTVPRAGASPIAVTNAAGEGNRETYTPVTVPNGSTLPGKRVDGAKVFHLVAEPVKREFAPGLVVDCWGYNGETPGPVIEAVEGDRVRIYVTNRLPEPTTVHWHGLLLPNGMDGVSGLNQPPIPPGKTFKYEFELRQSGTLMYHPHFDEMTQMGLGMMGMFIIHPRQVESPQIDRDFVLMLSEWFIKPGTSRPDPSVMSDFNILTMNSKAFPSTAPLVVKVGERVRIRLGNLGAMDHHPIHLHGYSFTTTGTDGGRVPESARWPETSVLVPVGATRDIEFVADAPGDWAMHCHMTHHVMNQMGHELPNLIGIERSGLDEKVRELLPDYMTMGDTGMGDMGEMAQKMGVPSNSIPMLGGRGGHGHIDMGGMFTVLKVRESLTDYSDPGWYENPPGTVAGEADAKELRRDGIKI